MFTDTFIFYLQKEFVLMLRTNLICLWAFVQCSVVKWAPSDCGVEEALSQEPGSYMDAKLCCSLLSFAVLWMVKMC